VQKQQQKTKHHLHLTTLYQLDFRSRVHKAFQNKDQDQTKVKNSSTMDFLKNLS